MTVSTIDRTRGVICRGVVATGIVALTLAVQAQQGDVDKPKRESTTSIQPAKAGDTATCLQEAAKMNNATIKFAQLAGQKGESAELKSFGQTLERDHKQAQTELETIARKHGVTLPTALDPKCEAEMTKLQGLNGAEFDKEFAKGAVEGHAMALAHLQQASREAKDPDVAHYTRNMLARVKDHQQRARDVAKGVGVDSATISALESKAQEGVGSPGAGGEILRGTGSSTKDPHKPDRPADPLK